MAGPARDCNAAEVVDLPLADAEFELPDGRRMAFDERGDLAGTPVLFFHGTPDTRLARHPDDDVARALGLRIVAADRPGVGASQPDPVATPFTVADDHAALLDHVQVDVAHVIAWSAGSIPALAFAGHHRARTTTLTLIAPLIPADAYGAPGVLDGADDSRRLFADVLGTVTPDEAGAELAMWLVPPEIDDALARELLADTLAELTTTPGAGETMVAALRGSVVQGMVGLEREIAAQATPLGSSLDEIEAPVTIHIGTDDTTTPPPMGRWLGDRLDARVVQHDAGHLLAITRWREILRGIAPA